MAGANQFELTDQMRVEAALARVKRELHLLDEQQLVRLNLDAQAASDTVLAALPSLRAVRSQLIKELLTFDVATFDRLEDYALALSFTNAAVQNEVPPKEPTDNGASLRIEATRLRNALRIDAKVLTQRGMIDSPQLSELKGGTGIQSLAHDLELLRRVLLSNWSCIEGKSAVTKKELQAASRIAREMVRVFKARESVPPELVMALDLRRRAFTLLLFAYDEARAAIAYVRRHEADAEEIAPSLYGGKGRG